MESLSKEELVAKVQQLTAHVEQLRNIIKKTNNGGEKFSKKRKEFDFSRFHTRHVAFLVSYFGWNYQGFVVQEDSSNTIEHELFEALLKTRLIKSRETSNYHRCGRTDKGVSAYSQVISLDVRTNLSEGLGVRIRETCSSVSQEDAEELNYLQMLNGVLPPEIRVHAWAPVKPDFSARFDCIKRTYKYYFPRSSLKLQAMKKAADLMLGEHDFRNLCKMDINGGVTSFTRKIDRIDIEDDGDTASPYCFCTLTVHAPSFLWHQIRCIVAILFLVGQEKEQPEIVTELLDVTSNPRKPQYTMAADLPLVLFGCEFPDINWNYLLGNCEKNIRHLQSAWCQHSVKARIMKDMLSDLESRHTALQGETVREQLQVLQPGSDKRNHKPLMKRPCAETLEDKLSQHSKKRKQYAKRGLCQEKQ